MVGSLLEATVMQYERILKSLRNHPALWGERGDAKEAQAERIIRKARARLTAAWNKRADDLEHKLSQRMLNAG